jgi:hypothetical protein
MSQQIGVLVNVDCGVLVPKFSPLLHSALGLGQGQGLRVMVGLGDLGWD